MYINNVSEDFFDFYVNKNDLYFAVYNGCACGACGCGCACNCAINESVYETNIQNVKI